MATTGKGMLNRLYAQTVAGTPLTSADLAAFGVSADLAVHYVRSGWLHRLSRGVFVRTGEEPNLHASLRLLERMIPGFHVGGKTALDWYGVRHYVAQQEQLHLYGANAVKLPAWFSERFPAEYHRKRLFTEPTEKPLHVAALEGRDGAPLVSAPERAMLELLSEIGVRQPFQEAKELMENAYNLRADVLQELLKRCTNVKTVRLCLQLGRASSLPWAQKLDATELPTGSARPWVARSSEGLLVLKA